MQTKHIHNKDVHKEANQSGDGAKRPPNTNGYSLSTEQLHQLLSGDQLNTCQNSFDDAVHKQQQLLTICNLLDRQNSIHDEIEDLLNAENGAYWLDKQISEFKLLCPTEILNQLSHSSNAKTPPIHNGDIINLHFLSLISEHLFSPLTTLSRIKTDELSEFERDDWYQWCLNFNDQLQAIKSQIKSAQLFFKLKTFDKIKNLAKDDYTKQQIGHTKKLFQLSTTAKQDVEYND